MASRMATQRFERVPSVMPGALAGVAQVLAR